MTDVEFNPDAKDGDNDGIIQEGTPFERTVEEADINPVEETVVEEAPAEEAIVVEETLEVAPEPEVIAAPEPEEEKPALVPVADGVIGAGKVKKKAAAKKAEPEAPAAKAEKVAIKSNRNLSWSGVGKIVRGYNIVSAADADKWLTLSGVELVSPEEVKANLG